jgi:hypothetical protein
MDGHQSSGSLAALLLGLGLLGGCSADALNAGGRSSTKPCPVGLRRRRSAKSAVAGWRSPTTGPPRTVAQSICPSWSFGRPLGALGRNRCCSSTAGRVPGVVSKASKRSLRGLAFSVMSSGRVSGISSCWRKEGRTGRTPTVVPAAVVSRDPRGCGRGCGPSGRLAAKSRQDYPDMPAAARSERIPARCI